MRVNVTSAPLPSFLPSLPPSFPPSFPPYRGVPRGMQRPPGFDKSEPPPGPGGQPRRAAIGREGGREGREVSGMRGKGKERGVEGGGGAYLGRK